MKQERYLGSYLRAISNALAQDMQQQTEQLGLTSSQGIFLHHLWMRQEANLEPTYSKDLEEFFYIKHPTVSGILQRMEAAGFIILKASEEDRRCKAILLTQKALDAHAQIQKHIQTSEARLTEGMTQAEQDCLRSLLKQAATNLGVGERPCFVNKKEGEKP